MVPLGGGSPEGAVQALAVGVGVAVVRLAVGVPDGVAIELGCGVEPQAETSASEAAATHRRIPPRSADSCSLLLFGCLGHRVGVRASPAGDLVDDALKVDARGRKLVGGA